MSIENYIFPKEIVLEVTNACNLSCSHCHFHSSLARKKRPIRFMHRDTWTKVLLELQNIDTHVSLLTHGAGEPLLHPELYEILQRARKIQGVSIGFMTNGMLLDETWSKKLVDLQLDFLALSIDGTVADTHDHYRCGADLEKIERNIVRLIQEKQRQGSALPVLSFNMVCYPAIENQGASYVEKWLPHASTVTLSKFRPVGSRKLWQNGPEVKFRPCPLLWNQMVIGCDGKVGLCCEDINIEFSPGTLDVDSMYEIYNKSKLLKCYRNNHLRGNVLELQHCSDCHIWSGDITLEEKIIEVIGIRTLKRITPAFTAYTHGNRNG